MSETVVPFENDPKAILSSLEKGLFIKLFNRKGYVLNFSTNDFDVFTMESVGVALCRHYDLSKGKSLVAYCNDADECSVIKLLLDLFDYYEQNYENEFTEEKKDYSFMYSEEYAQTYRKCKTIVQRIRGNNMPLQSVAQELKDQFSTQYMNSQFDLMLSLCDTNPTEAIGKAKELIESCCITILDDRKVDWDKKWDIGKLASETVSQLKLTPQDIPDDKPLAENMKAILGNLRAIATNVATLRNPYGSGHGKAASYKGLEKRHARLAVGSSITFVDFLWATHEKRKMDSI